MRKFLVPFLFLAACWTIVAAFVGLAVQQNYRTSANDPQIQDVEDVVTALNAGQQLSLQPDGTDISTSLSTFIVLYDSKGTVLGSNVTFNGQLPQIPKGVFAYVDKHAEDRFTWEPIKGDTQERFAVVVGKASVPDQYVAVGRSLREIRSRERQLLGFVAIAWTLLLMVSLFGCYWLVEGCPCPRCAKKRSEEAMVKCEECGKEHNKHHVHMHHAKDSKSSTAPAEDKE